MIPDLVYLCLDSVAKNLARHHLQFTTCKEDDFYTKRNLELLQKRYSSELMSRLNAEDGLSEEFLDIVVNRHTKFLDTRWFKKCPLTKLTSTLAEIGSNLESIVCHYQCTEEGLPEAIRDSVCHLIHLKSFTFWVKCDDGILRNVAKFCPRIQEIDVRHSDNITSEGVRCLCRDRDGRLLCPMLKMLCFGRNERIDSKDVQYILKHFPSLEVMGHPDLPEVLYALHKDHLPFLDRVAPYNITTLSLMSYGCVIEDDIVKMYASVCPRLKNFSCVLGEQEQLSSLLILPELEQFHIMSYDKINVDSFLTSKGSRLTSLCIKSCTVSVPVLAEKCPRLRELILDGADLLGDEDSKAAFHSLSSLTFSRYETDIPTHLNGMRRMLSSSLVKLESLTFDDCYLEPPELKKAILKCCESCPLRNVVFDDCWIETEFMADLLHICSTLNRLTLGYNFEDTEHVLLLAERLPNKPKISIGPWIPPSWLSLLSF